MHKKTALKWQKLKKQKDQVNESPTAINFKTHQLSQSQVEIIIPKQYPQFLKNNPILVIDLGKDKIIAQVSSNHQISPSRQQIQDKNQISVLKTLLDLHGIQCRTTGTIKGQIRTLNQTKISEHSLQYVQFLAKDTYFSRRDQYKVMKALKESTTHVFLKKTLYFDQIALQVHTLMKNNQTLAKSGIIDKNTKFIFRTNCSKLTVGIQLSIQTFELNENKELYLQKMIEFLYVFLQRNTYFNATHRLTLIFFGRCFYPQFKSLQDAYNYLIKENTTIEERQQERFQRNFSVALQKDHHGRIFQDVYRRIIWSSDMIDNFRQFFWEKISQFIFTLNWDSQVQSTIGKYITKSLQSKIHQKTVEEKCNINFDKSNLKIKPFIHKLKSKLAKSKDSNIFQAISLISQQYRHHYKFRSLNETGNTIIFLSAGLANYQVDDLSYKMAKSYIYLTNITCSLVNFRKKSDSPIKAQICFLENKPLYKGPQDRKKLQNLTLNCIEKQVYMSPMNEDMQIWDNFQTKNMIFPSELKLADEKRSKALKDQHHCQLEHHYILQQQVDLKNKTHKIKQKYVSFIDVYAMNDTCLYIHQKLYDKLIINKQMFSNSSKNECKYKQIDIFGADLDRIIISKTSWDIECTQNDIDKKLHNFRDYIDKSYNKNDKKQRNLVIERTSRKIFKTYSEEDQTHHFANYETMSNQDGKINNNDDTSSWLNLKKRKNSDYYQIESQTDLDLENKGKINIFEETYKNKNHEYNAGQKSQSKYKKYSTHNKERLKNCFFESNIHYLMPNFNEDTYKKFRAFIRKQYIEQLKDEQEDIIILFQTEKMWKNLCFPLLTPIYTKYKQFFKQPQQNLDTGVIDQSKDKRISIIEDQVCKLLMKNYQIEQTSTQYLVNNMVTKLSKGHISCHLKMNGNNLSRSYIIDKIKQQSLTPFMLYRYLCYEDKDCRFCAKYVYFEDKNFYSHKSKQELQTKTIKIALAAKIQNNNIDPTSSLNSNSEKKEEEALSSSFNLSKRDPFVQFIRMFNEKYREFATQISRIQPKQTPKRKTISLNFVKKQRALYHHEQVEMEIDTQYNPHNLFQILVSWNLCSSVIIRQLIDTIMTMGRRSKLKPSLLTACNIFHTIWSIATIGEIIFNHKISLDFLENHILGRGQWLWDSNDYYLHQNCGYFIQFKKEKKLILWRDNNHQKRNKDIKKDDSAKQYNEFFMKAAIFDIFGGIVQDILDNHEKLKEKYRIYNNL